MLLLSLAFLLQSCGGSYKPPTYKSESKPFTKIEKEIDRTEQQIFDMEKFRTEQLHKATINNVKDFKDRSAVKLDGKSSYGDIADRGYAEVAAAEKEIKRLEEKLGQLENKRDAAKKQPSGGGNKSGGSSSGGGSGYSN